MYTGFAPYYDRSGRFSLTLLLASYLIDLLDRRGVMPSVALDVACGTGTLAIALAERGWRVTGLDRSAAMLDVARERVAEAGLEAAIDLEQADMRAIDAPTLRLAPSYQLITCTYDSLNYLLSEADLHLALAGMARRLAPGGYLLADYNTRLALEAGWPRHQRLDLPGYRQRERSRFDQASATRTIEIAGFVADAGRWRRQFGETHRQRAFPPAVLQAAFAAAGLTVEMVYDCFSSQPASAATSRALWLARR